MQSVLTTAATLTFIAIADNTQRNNQLPKTSASKRERRKDKRRKLDHDERFITNLWLRLKAGLNSTKAYSKPHPLSTKTHVEESKEKIETKEGWL
jgi:hypothetical protein